LARLLRERKREREREEENPVTRSGQRYLLCFGEGGWIVVNEQHLA
jgi:hypothetical protein